MNAIEQYNELIQSGKIPACKKLKKVYGHIVANMHDPECPYIYNEKKANMAIDFIETFIHIPKLAGNPIFKLELWQKAFISVIFGFVSKETGYRQYREAFLYLGRKNSKSVMSAAIANYFLACEGDAPEIYSAATKRDQAKIIWDYAKIMVQSSPALKKHLKIRVNRIENPYTMGKFVPLSKDSDSLDGLNCSLILIDELHAIQDRNMYDVLQGGTYARKQPLTLITSTGGYIQPDSIFETKYQEYNAIIDGYTSGKYKDEAVFPCIYELDNKNEVNDEALWIKANPNLGVSKNVELLRKEVNRARLDEKTMKDLLAKQFNLQQLSQEAFFSLDDIRNTETFDIDKLRGAYCFGGVDLSETTDLTCAVLLIAPPGSDVLYVHQMYWLPEDTLQDHIERDKAPYDKWISAGYVRTCPGNIIDQAVITQWMLEVQQQYGLYVYKIGYDRYNAQYLTKDLQLNFGERTCEPVSQTFRGITDAMYKSKAYFQKARINYNYNPVFLWCLMNVQALYDNAGNVKPYKNRNLNVRIDGYSAFLDAFSVYLAHQDELG